MIYFLLEKQKQSNHFFSDQGLKDTVENHNLLVNKENNCKKMFYFCKTPRQLKFELKINV